MKVRHQREKDLMPHYEAHPKYYSFAEIYKYYHKLVLRLKYLF